MDKMHAYAAAASTLNESPSEKEGKLGCRKRLTVDPKTLNESPSEKEGKSLTFLFIIWQMNNPQ